MTELTTTYQSIAGLVEQLAKWESTHNYMTRHHIINDELVYDVLIATNHCTFTLRESLYPVLTGEALVDVSTLKIADSLLGEIEDLEIQAVKLDNANSSIEKAINLYLLTLQASTLRSRAKLMLEAEAKSRNRAITVVVPRAMRTQSSFAL